METPISQNLFALPDQGQHPTIADKFNFMHSGGVWATNKNDFNSSRCVKKHLLVASKNTVFAQRVPSDVIAVQANKDAPYLPVVCELVAMLCGEYLK